VKHLETPVVSFGPLTLLVALLLCPAIHLYQRARLWHAEHYRSHRE
jgi:hypothetical protein